MGGARFRFRRFFVTFFASISQLLLLLFNNSNIIVQRASVLLGTRTLILKILIYPVTHVFRSQARAYLQSLPQKLKIHLETQFPRADPKGSCLDCVFDACDGIF